MGKAIITVPIEIRESDAVSAVLRAKNNSRFAVIGATIANAFNSLVDAAKFRMIELSGALSGAVVTRTLYVRKSAGRFFVTENNAEGVNLAVQADLRFKSFGSFGEFVATVASGLIPMGATPATAGSAGTPGKFVVSLPAGSGGTLESDGTISLGVAGELEIGPSHSLTDPAGIAAAIVGLLGTRSNGYTVISQEMGGMSFEVILTASNDVETIGGSFGTFSRTGYVAPTGSTPGLPGNAIELDQIAGIVRFVRIENEPPGETVLDFSFPESTAAAALFE